MKALVLKEPGDEPELVLADVPDPVPGPGYVVVQVAACGFCRHDVAVMAGVLRRGVTPDIVLGHEVSGTVVDVGADVDRVKAGDFVVAALTTFCGECERCTSGREYRCPQAQGLGHAIDGGFAQFVKLPERGVVPISRDADLLGASILACPIGVAVQALEDVAALRKGETVLVVGAGGGVGIHAVQVAGAMGARVLAVTTSADKVARIEEHTSAEVILAGELDFSEIAMALTEDIGVDVVINPVGSAVFDSCLRSLAQFGRMVLLGEITGGHVSLSPVEVLFRDAAILGSTGASVRHIAEAAELVGKGEVTPVISNTYALSEAAEAYREIRAGRTLGRVVLIP